MDPLAQLNPYIKLKEEPDLKKIYEPLALGQTRFLRFLGRDETQPDQLLSFKLETHTIKSTPRPNYAALSYTWGHPTIDDFKDDLSNAIVCNGQRMPIGFNLYHALCYFFGAAGTEDQPTDPGLIPDLLWIDAISIDQSNIAERATQVQQMTSIYISAAKVIVWLGSEDQDAKDAHAFLGEYVPVLDNIIEAAARDDPMSGVVAQQHNVHDDPSFHQKFGTTQKSLDQWKALIRFFQRRWFLRLWVVQELSYATNVVICCSDLRFTWHEFDIFVSLVFGAQWCGLSLPELQREMGEIANIFTFYREIRFSGDLANMYGQESDMLTAEQKLYSYAEYCMTQSAILKATDPRDRIFALHPFLASHAQVLDVKLIWLKADYTATVRQIFLITVQVIVWKTRSLNFLSYVSDLSCREKSDLPSWVPHFHVSGAVAAVESLLQLHQARNFHAGSLSRAVVTPSDIYVDMDTGNLGVKGAMVDEVIEVVRHNGDMLKVLDICLRLPLKDKDGRSPVEVLWRTLIAGRTDTHFPAPPETEKEFARYIRSIALGSAFMALQAQDSEALLEKVLMLGELDKYCRHPAVPSQLEFMAMTKSATNNLNQVLAEMRATHATCTYRPAITPTPSGQMGKALIRTKSGVLGLGPHSSEPGDEVWLFRGASLFHVLRNEGKDDGTKMLLGEGYLQGFMEGEFLRRDDLDWTAVHIS